MFLTKSLYSGTIAVNFGHSQRNSPRQIITISSNFFLDIHIFLYSQ